MTRLLLAVALAVVVGVGAWALFLRSSDEGHRLLVGALEDAIKLPDPKLADERIALASRAGFNHSCCLSASAWKYVRQAAITSSMSPAIAAGRLWRV